jgi:peptidoglycan-N-acetylglucosamine deacetylase
MSKYFITSSAFLFLLIVSLTIDGMIDVPLWWYVVLVLVFIGLTAAGSFLLSWEFYLPVRSSGSGNAIALTFDDGPVPGKTDRILDVLASRDVKASFFCIGSRVAANRSLAGRIFNEGHLLGNHSFFHSPTFDLQSTSMITKELSDTDTAIHEVTGKKPKFFRPPYGVTNPMVARAVSRRNYTVIGWSVRSFDTVIRDPRKLFQRVSKPLRGGDIVLFHDHCDQTIEILPALLDHIKNLGLKVVRVDELLNEKPYV